jgi:hypothetical protein
MIVMVFAMRDNKISGMEPSQIIKVMDKTAGVL